MQFVDLKRQYHFYQSEVETRVQRVFEHGQYILGPEILELENLLSKRVGVKHVTTVSSGTASLEIALRAIGVGPGDEVITVPFTWISSAEAILLVGATPRFVDIEAESFNLDPDRIADAISSRTKALIAVNLFGQMADFGRIFEIAGKAGLSVIEDGAQSFGAAQNGIQSCGASIIGTTSFFPTKPLGCYGDGGAVFTNDDELAERMVSIRSHGLVGDKHCYLGTNGRFDTLQAAILLAKLPHFEGELAQRRRIATRYSSEFLDSCCVPTPLPGNDHVYACYTIRVPKRDEIAERLQSRGIPTKVYYPRCLHDHPALEGLGYQMGDFPVAERAAREVISLPVHPFLTEPEQEKIISVVKDELTPIGPLVP